MNTSCLRRCLSLYNVSDLQRICHFISILRLLKIRLYFVRSFKILLSTTTAEIVIRQRCDFHSISVFLNVETGLIGLFRIFCESYFKVQKCAQSCKYLIYATSILFVVSNIPLIGNLNYVISKSACE